MKYGAEITKELCAHLQSGLGRVDSCTLVDISYETFTEWMKKPEFSESVKKAEAKCKQRNIGIIQKAAIKTWTAAAWWLERKYPEEFAVKQKLEHTGDMIVKIVNFSEEKPSEEKPKETNDSNTPPPQLPT